MASPKQTNFEAPKGPPVAWTLDVLKNHLQTAMLVELYTIPLYLFAAYSITSSSNDAAKKIIGE